MFSDVYVFGIGSEVKKEQLNSLASKKRDEKHVFILKDYETLGVVFNRIISKWQVTPKKSLCVLCQMLVLNGNDSFQVTRA